jgi:hypothetical protein
MVSFVAEARPENAKANLMTNETSLRDLKIAAFDHTDCDFPGSATRRLLLATSIIFRAPQSSDRFNHPQNFNCGAAQRR